MVLRESNKAMAADHRNPIYADGTAFVQCSDSSESANAVPVAVGTLIADRSPERSVRARLASSIVAAISPMLLAKACVSWVVVAPTCITSAGRFRKAIPNPTASRIGKMSIRKIASGSRRISRNRTVPKKEIPVIAETWSILHSGG